MFSTYSHIFFNRYVRNAVVLLIKIIHIHYLVWTLSSNQWLMYLMFFRVLILSSSHFHRVLTEFQVIYSGIVHPILLFP